MLVADQLRSEPDSVMEFSFNEKIIWQQAASPPHMNYESPRSLSHRPLQQHLPHVDCDCELCPMTLTFEYDLESVKMNQHAKHLYQRSLI